MRDAVHAPLLALAHVMEEGRGDQVGFRVATGEEPACRGRAMHDVAWVLLQEERQQRRAEVELGEREIAAHRQPGRIEELMYARANHSAGTVR